VADGAVDLSPGARRLVHVNGRVQAGEVVVVVTNPTMRRYADSVAAVARDAGADVTVCIIPMRDQDGQEPPPPVALAMAQAAVIFSPVRISITHTRAMRTALDAGARVCMMTAYTDAIMTSPALLETDFAAQADVCRRLGAAFTEGESVRLTSRRGTDLRFGIEGRVANVLTNIPEPGELAPVPDIEVNVVPVTGSAEGTLIMDASVPYLGIGILEGTIHIGIGTSHTLGGEIVAPTHYDLLMWEPTIAVDGRVVQRDKQVLA